MYMWAALQTVKPCQILGDWINFDVGDQNSNILKTDCESHNSKHGLMLVVTAPTYRLDVDYISINSS